MKSYAIQRDDHMSPDVKCGNTHLTPQVHHLRRDHEKKTTEAAHLVNAENLAFDLPDDSIARTKRLAKNTEDRPPCCHNKQARG